MIEDIYKKYFFKIEFKFNIQYIRNIFLNLNLNLIYDIENIFLSLNLFFKNIDFISLLLYNIQILNINHILLILI